MGSSVSVGVLHVRKGAEVNNAVTRVEGNRTYVAPPWMSRREVCEHLSISPKALRGLTKSGAVERRFTSERAIYRAASARAKAQAPQREIERPDRLPPGFRTARVVAPEAPSTVSEDVEAVRLLRVAKLALRQRDRAVANKLAAEQERDALKEKLVRVDAAVTRGKQQRDRLLVQRDRSRQQRDQLAMQFERAINQRDRAMAQRDALLDRVDRALEQRDRSIEQFDAAYDVLQDWQMWHERAQETLDRYEARSERAARLAGYALTTPWWAFARRKAIEKQLHEIDNI